ncbi:MAG TPA: right-handed parallel beta-helix repeat-containing protein [Pyrinomonadaceae bacterium]
MNNLRKVFFTSIFIVLISTTAQAQASRTWVSGVGDDVNPCSRTAPCKTFAGAVPKTAAGGEISVLDPGGYGTVVIRKSLTIDGTGMLSSMLALTGTTGVTIDMTEVKDPSLSAVRLRGLSISGMNTGANGINIISAGSVSIEDCVIDGFKGSGIRVGAGSVFVRNTTIRNNVTAGITVTAGQAAIADVALVFNGVGIVGSVKSLGNVYLFGNKTGDPS